MIAPIDTNHTTMALRLLELQMAAYAAETELVGITGLPAPNEGLFSLQRSRESFWGYFEGERLLGAISYTVDDGEVTIRRVMVHPAHFRRGIASRLLRFVLERERHCGKFVVSAITRNTPAIQLYRKHGFAEIHCEDIAPGLSISRFEKTVAK